MPYRITFALGLSEEGAPEETLAILLRGLTAIDRMYLAAHPEIPALYKSGVRQMVEPPGQDCWQDIPTTINMGIGDSEELVAWRAAELQNAKIPATVTVRNEGGRFKAYVRLPNGMLEDPTKKLLGVSASEHDHWIVPPSRPGHPYRVTFALDLFNGPHERDLSRAALNVMLQTLLAIDMRYLRFHRNTPSVYNAGVRYMEEPPGQEDWQDIPTCMAMKLADCEDLACWRAAELRMQGIDAQPFFTEQIRPNGGYLYHIMVRIPGQKEPEDTSHVLGMR